MAKPKGGAISSMASFAIDKLARSGRLSPSAYKKWAVGKFGQAKGGKVADDYQRTYYETKQKTEAATTRKAATEAARIKARIREIQGQLNKATDKGTIKRLQKNLKILQGQLKKTR